MLIRILHFFLIRSINIVMDFCYNGNPTGSKINKHISKILIMFAYIYSHSKSSVPYQDFKICHKRLNGSEI